jgi:hypothetical protein
VEGSRLFASGGGGTNYEVLHLKTMLVCAPATQRTSRYVQNHIEIRDRNLLIPFQTRETCICTTPGYTVIETRALEASGLFSPVLTASPFQPLEDLHVCPRSITTDANAEWVDLRPWRARVQITAEERGWWL